MPFAEMLNGTLFDDLPVSLALSRQSDGAFLRVNDKFAQMFGFTPAEMLGKTSTALGMFAEGESRQPIVDALRRDGSVQNAEIRMRRKDGSSIIVVSSIVLVTVSGETCLLASNVDISERKRLEQELAEARVLADRASAAKSQFLANMSHEIRTPMNGVIGMTSLLMETTLDERQREYANTIRVSGEHLLTIINDILDFSKIESGKLDLDQHPFDVRQTVEEAVDLVAHQASAKGIELVYAVQRDVPLGLLGDAGRLRQVLVNLLSNAVKFTQKGEVVLNARAVSNGASPIVRFSVSDTGIGIAADKLERLFKAFSQGDASTTRRFGGTGLGLVISDRLVGLMGGKIQVESEPGRGSTFSFDIALPVSRIDSAEIDLAQERVQGRRALIVDDHATNRRIVRDLLGFWRMTSDEAASGAEALARAGAERYDVAILDYQMPEMDGVDVARKLRERFPRLPLVMLTSLGGLPSTVSPGLFAGTLAKPVKPSALFDAIVSAVHGTRSTGAGVGDNAPPKPLPALRILVVEDNAVNVKLAQRMLERLGQRSDVAADGSEALTALERQPYDVVFMDIQMPILDGIETTKAIRSRWGDKGPRIVGLSAHALPAERDEAIAAGMNDYLVKPLELKKLEAVLHRAQPSVPTAVDTALDPRTLDALAEDIGIDGMVHVLKTFVTVSPAVGKQFEEGMATADRKMIERAAHTLKSNSAMLGGAKLSLLCQRIEADAATRPWPELRDAIAEVQRLLAGARESATSEAARLSLER